MKNAISIFLFLFLISCGDDDSSNDPIIVGEWRLASVSITNCPDSNNNIPLQMADTVGCTTLNTTMLCQTIVFNADGTGVNTSMVNGETNNQDITFTVDESTNMVTSCDENNNCVTFSVTNNLFSLSNPFGDCMINASYIKS